MTGWCRLNGVQRGDVVYTCKRVIEKNREGPVSFPKESVMWKVDMIHRSTGKKVTVQDYNKKRAISQAFEILSGILYPSGTGD